jgi:hypothetical protein
VFSQWSKNGVTKKKVKTTVSIVECQFFQVCIFYLFPHIHIAMQYGFFFLITDYNRQKLTYWACQVKHTSPNNFGGAVLFGQGVRARQRSIVVWRGHRTAPSDRVAAFGGDGPWATAHPCDMLGI